MSTLLPITIEKQIARTCTYSGCDDRADDDSEYCGPHEAHERGRKANAARRRRQRLADAGVCIVEGCGRKVPKRKRKNGTVQQRRCGGCGKEHRAAMRVKSHAPGVAGMGAGVAGDPSDPLWRVDPGTTWKRFRGKGRRGRLTREEQAAEDKRDAKFAIDAIKDFIGAIDIVMSEAVQALGRIQRDEAKRQAAQHLGSARRFLEDLEERYGADGA